MSASTKSVDASLSVKVMVSVTLVPNKSPVPMRPTTMFGGALSVLKGTLTWLLASYVVPPTTFKPTL